MGLTEKDIDEDVSIATAPIWNPLMPRAVTASLAGHDDRETESRLASWIGYLFITLLILMMGVRYLYRGDLYLTFFADDFFYYLEIARNIAGGHGSSFDTIHLTNGYHPLWMVIILGSYFVLGGTFYLFVFISASICIICFVAFRFYYYIAYKICGNLLYGAISSLYTGIFMAAISRTGMEISLALLIDSMFIWRFLDKSIIEQSNNQSLWTGLLVSMIFLARIDAIILPAMLLLGDALINARGWGKLIEKITFVALGAVLIPVYLAVNYYIFGVFLPISGTAKQLRRGVLPVLRPFERFVVSDALNGPFVWPICISIICVGIGCITQRKSQIFRSNQECILVICAALYPFLYYFVISTRSDWPIWTWYLYPFVVTSAVITPYLFRWLLAIQVTTRFRILPIVSIVLVSILVTYEATISNKVRNEVYITARKISEFSEKYRGILAMGDRAGLTGYIVRGPILQLEGIVGDVAMLDNIQSKRNLADVLKENQIKYYIATDPSESEGCLVTQEPALAGSLSPRMVGSFCQQPIEEFLVGTHRTVILPVTPN